MALLDQWLKDRQQVHGKNIPLPEIEIDAKESKKLSTQFWEELYTEFPNDKLTNKGKFRRFILKVKRCLVA